LELPELSELQAPPRRRRLQRPPQLRLLRLRPRRQRLHRQRSPEVYDQRGGRSFTNCRSPAGDTFLPTTTTAGGASNPIALLKSTGARGRGHGTLENGASARFNSETGEQPRNRKKREQEQQGSFFLFSSTVRCIYLSCITLKKADASLKEPNILFPRRESSSLLGGATCWLGRWDWERRSRSRGEGRCGCGLSIGLTGPTLGCLCFSFSFLFSLLLKVLLGRSW
jgi:hypothetical protein